MWAIPQRPAPVGAPVSSEPAPQTPFPAATSPSAGLADHQGTLRSTRLGGTITTILPVELDSAALSLRGWRILKPQASLISEGDSGTEYTHRLEISGTATYDPSSIDESFARIDSWPPPVVAVLSAPLISPFAHTSIPFHATRESALAPLEFTDTTYFTDSMTWIDHESVSIAMTSFDAYEGGLANMPIRPHNIPSRFVDETPTDGLKLELSSSSVLVWESGEYEYYRRSGIEAEKHHGCMRLNGSVAIGGVSRIWESYKSQEWIDEDDDRSFATEVPFEVYTPSIKAEFHDKNGKVVGERDLDIEMAVRVSASGDIPNRRPVWYVDEKFDPDEFSEMPSNVLFRICGWS